MKRVEPRTIVITGASSGIGKGLKESFEKKGDKVITISLEDSDYNCDVSDTKKLEKIFHEIGKDNLIDILITCAGYGISGAVELLDEEMAKKEFDVNFWGSVNTCRLAIPIMKPKSKIVMISSATALFPVPFKAYYCSSKAAVSSFSQCLRMELSQTEIQVTAICPGDIRTNFSKNRVKIYDTNERYGSSIQLSTEPTEKTEKRRMAPEYAIKKIEAICEKDKLKPQYIVGKQYKMFNFLKHISSLSVQMKVLKKLFYKKPKNKKA